MTALLDHPRRRTVEAMVVTGREVNDGEKERVAGLDAHRAAPGHARAAGESAALRRTEFFRDRGVDRLLHGLIRLQDGRIEPHAVLLRQGRRGRSPVRGRIRGEFRGGCFFLFSAGRGGEWRRGGRGADELREAVLDPVHVRKLAVVDDRHLAIGERYRHAVVAVRHTRASLDAEERVEGVREPFDLLDTCALHGAKVQHRAVRRGNEGGVGDGSCAGREGAIEKGAEGRVFAEVGGLDFCEVAAKEEGVCLEADGSEPDGQLK